MTTSKDSDRGKMLRHSLYRSGARRLQCPGLCPRTGVQWSAVQGIQQHLFELLREIIVVDPKALKEQLILEACLGTLQAPRSVGPA